MTRWLVALLVCLPAVASATPITYAIHSAPGTATVDGFLTADGRIGVLDATDILSFDLALRVGGATGTIASRDGGIVNIGGRATIATPSTLTFVFPATKDSTFLRFTTPPGRSALAVWCLGGICSAFPAQIESVDVSGATDSVLRNGVTETIGAAVQAVPEPSVATPFAAGWLAWRGVRRRPSRVDRQSTAFG